MSDPEQAGEAPHRGAFGPDGRFVVEAEIGAGGMGVVYRVHDQERRMAMALKTIRDAEPLGIYQFKREFRALADVSHPNLVALYELGVHGADLFFTMELIEGQGFLDYLGVARRAVDPGAADAPTAAPRASQTQTTAPTGGLRDVFTEHAAAQAAAAAPVDVARLRHVLGQLAAGVVALHDAGYLHRDIKPSNVLVTPAGRVVLLDFGIASELRPTRFGDDAPHAGTPGSMAPELVAGSAPATAASDWYSVGVMLYRAFTGGAFPSPPGIAGIRAPRLSELVPGVAPDLDELCARLLDADPTRRPSDDEMRALAHAASGVPRDLLLVARAAELGALMAALRETRGGRAVVVRLHGASGMGKTALARRFSEDAARELDALVLAGRCYERESVPYKAIDSVIDELTRYLIRLPDDEAVALLPTDMPLLARMFPVLRRVRALAEPAGGGADVDPLEQQGRAFAALRELFARIARVRPLVLFIDDVQWGDLDSARLLDAVVRPPGEPPLLVILGHRREAGGPFLAALSRRQSRLGHAQRSLEVRVDALEPAAARELAAALLAGSGLSASAAQRVADESRGIPYFIHELCRFLAEAPRGAPAARLPALDEVIAARVAALPEAARRLLEVIAVAGSPVAPRVALEAAQLEQGEALYRLRSARLVLAAGASQDDRVETYHDRIRETIVAHLSDATRRERHLRLAERLEAAGADPEVLSAHFEAGGEPGHARGYALAAARLACDALAFERGAELYAKALALGGAADPERRELQRALAQALVHAGHGHAAAEVFLAAAEGEPLDQRLRLQISAASQLFRSGHVDEGLVVLQRLVDAVGVRLPATPRRALLSVVAQRALLRLRGRPRPRLPGAVPAPLLDRLNVYEAVAEGLGFVDNIRGADFQNRFLRLALRAGEPAHVVNALAREAVYLSVAGPRVVARAHALLAQADELAAPLGDERLLARNLVARGLVSFFVGEFSGALAELARGDQAAQGLAGSSWELGTTRYIGLLAMRHLGHLDEMRHLFDVYVRDALRRGDRYVETSLRRTCNVVHLAADDPAEARRDLDLATWSASHRGFHVQHWYAAWAEAELALYVGDPAAQLAAFPGTWRGLERSFHNRIQTVRASALWCFGRLALASGAPGLPRAGWCAARLEREQVGYAAAWAMLLRAGVEAVRGARAPAIAWLERAITTAEREHLGMCELSARLWLGRRVGGSAGAELVAGAVAAMRARGVVAPERMARLYAPGLDA